MSATSKRGQRIVGSAGQTSLLDLLRQAREAEEAGRPAAGSLNVTHRLREALVAAIKGSPLSRWEIASRMSEYLGTEVSKFQVDAWTCESKDGHRFPAEYLPAFCRAVESAEPLKILGQAAGLFVLQGPEALRSEIQRIDEGIRKMQVEKRKRLTFLEEMEGKA